jgi:hypothetical protein
MNVYHVYQTIRGQNGRNRTTRVATVRASSEAQALKLARMLGRISPRAASATAKLVHDELDQRPEGTLIQYVQYEGTL